MLWKTTKLLSAIYVKNLDKTGILVLFFKKVRQLQHAGRRATYFGLLLQQHCVSLGLLYHAFK